MDQLPSAPPGDSLQKRETEEQRKQHQKKQEQIPFWTLGILLSTALLLLVLYAATAGDASAVLFAVELGIGLAALVGGGLLGFLFGIPRTTQGARPATAAAGEPVPQRTIEPSNNLEQVSDWLTKILVGAGLVQLEELRATLSEVGSRVATAVGGRATSALTQVTLIVFGIIGFLGGFLWTRLYYGGMQARADRGIQETMDALEKKFDKKIEQESLTNQVKLARAVGTTPPAAPVAPDPGVAQKIQQFRNAAPVWDSDPVKDIFGTGPSEAAGFTLTGSIDTQANDYLVLTLRVAGSAAAPINGTVTFVLHPLTTPPVQTVTAQNNVAETTFPSEGWFHAAAVVNGSTVLVLDLRNVPGVPKWFTEI